MRFTDKLTRATLIKRYKRFLADVELDNGDIVIAHCANSGAMTGCAESGWTVYLSPNRNPKAKLDWRWEMVDCGTSLIGINTSRPNHIVEEAILDGSIRELQGYATLKREVKYGKNSRIDILLNGGEKGDQLCYVEVKSVTLKIDDKAAFPDAVTTRGTKHLNELIAMVEAGHRAVMVYLVQREDCVGFTPAAAIDPTYARTLQKAASAGVELICYSCRLTEDAIWVKAPLPISLKDA